MSELPQGWSHVHIDELISLNPKNDCPEAMKVGFVPMSLLGTSYLEDLRFEEKLWADVKKGYTHFADGDVLLAKITPCFENGKAGIANSLPNGVGAGSTEYFVCRVHPDKLFSKYLLAFFKTAPFMKNGEVNMTGSVGHKRVPKSYLLNTKIPLAPPPEQKRIADKLDTLLTRVDATRQQLDRIPTILKRFRQSVLAAATSGRLTEGWREENPPIASALDEIKKHLKIRQRAEKKPQAEPDLSNWESELPTSWVVCSVHQFAECLDRLRVPIKRDERKNLRGLYPYYGANGEVGKIDEYIFDDELVLVTEDETFYGRERPIAYRSSGKCWVNNHAHVLKPPSKLAADYLCFSLMYYNVIPWLTGTTGRAKLTQQALNALPIAVPTEKEMGEIVRRVETLFILADKLEARYTTARAQVDKLTPALLAKAFRGELVEQDPNDEPATVLLARIRAARDTAPNTSKKLRKQRQGAHDGA